MNGRQIGYETDATIADLDLQRVGQDFGVSALAMDRYQSTISGHVTASGSGTADAMNVAANGTVHDTSIMGGRIPRWHSMQPFSRTQRT